RARSNASGPQGYQSTGLCWCWSRYGLVSRARRFVCACSLTSVSGSGRDEGERGHVRGRAPVPDADGDRAPRLEVLAPDVAEGDGRAEGDRAHGRGHPAHLLVLRHDDVSGCGHRVALEDETGEGAIDVAAILHARHRLLTDVAALGVA